MKAARFLAIVLLILAVLAGGVYLFRLPLAGWAARSALASAGFEKPAARVSALSLHGATLEGVAARAGGAEAFRFERIETDFNWRRVLAERAVETLRVGPGSVRLKLSDDGKVSLAGLPAQSGKGGALPFRSVTLSDVAFIVDAPDGGASGAVNATYDVANGGTASMTLASERLALRGVEFTAVDASGNAILSADGTIGFEATVRADMAATGAAAKDVALALKGGGSSWKDAAAGATDKLAVTARLDFSAPDIAFRQQETQPVMSADQMKMLFGEEISRAALTGALDIAFAGGAVETRIAADAPLTLTTPDGGALTVMPQGEAPFYATSPARDRASFRFTLASDGVDASGGADYENENGRWRFAAPLEIEAYDSGGLAVDRTTLLIDATSESESLINADVTVRSGVRKATIGRLAISDAPIKGAFSVAADTRARRATVMNKSGCFTLERGKGRIAEQDLETSLEDVTLCDTGAPVAVITWAGDAACSVAGVLTAKKGSLRLGKTTARGRPPALTFDATYHPAENRTVINGVIRDGAMTLNDGLDMSDVDGRFDFTLEKEAMRASAKVDQLRVAQHRNANTPLLFAPVMAAGDASLEGDAARFSYVMTTPEGYRLGTGEGTHDMAKASGQTVFSFGNILFLPVGLQPNRIFPALKGIVDGAQGEVGGEMRFGWTPKGVTSSAEFDFGGVSFNGPTRAVTRTSGVSGTVALTNLMPLTTDGLQTITVDAVDLDALKLAGGAISFEFPGDDTFHLAQGEFPWFGGTIGVYGATASMSGKADIPLKARNVDLQAVLAYLDVEGLSGEGILSGELPLIFEDGRARIVDGVLRSEGPGAIRYVGAASAAAAEAGEDARLAFDLLRNLRYTSLDVAINGALDGQLVFNMKFQGEGDVTVQKRNVSNVPVLYRVNLSVENIDLVRKAGLSGFIRSEIQRALEEDARRE